MAKKKPLDTPRKRAALKDLAPPASGTDKVRGGALLVSTQPLQASRQWLDGNSQPPNDLRKK